MQVTQAALARLCIAVSTHQGQSTVDWTSDWHGTGGTPLVIPKESKTYGMRLRNAPAPLSSHPFLDSHSNQPPVHGIARDESGDHRELHRTPKFHAIDRGLTAKGTFEDDELQDRHQAVHSDLPSGQR